MTTQTATLTRISTVAIPVSDQDATKRLFEELGFETRFDGDVNVDFRWIGMAPPGGGTTLSVIAATDALPTGIDTGIRFITPNARAAHARLVDLGLRVGDLLDWPTAPLMFEFWDLDGNTMYVAEPE
ncbi:VOC family protein [Geodermatophilus obscurus]|uniref:Glyoxalase/bleomycin resistance protein/dioxygenase n=1 Tax=Geodermatophilus obscurus (strain ATCC 25078 / DSM 43160 / JCM 3152 / CCUG 61914 / KCC A-0152 / KCTC 9177 / NBRC 13315 / NRRL B-3577 / G-20) TaxID=526225 RepID=D2SC72_GEOOG|nr:VOC family protein [Geodermatophilus obscurus]ADB74240.1 Glyoxalase/bleomycin resistance protein/dioxygenase [Geodermatophilus obscurus DSM 43160]